MLAAALSQAERPPKQKPIALDSAPAVGVVGNGPRRLGGLDPNNPIRCGGRADLAHLLKRLGASLVWTGGAEGAQEDACQVALELGIPFGLVLPFPSYEAHWYQAREPRSVELHARAHRRVFVSRLRPLDAVHAQRLFQKADEFVVYRSKLLIALWDGSPGHTEHAVAVARACDCPILRIDPRRWCAHGPS